MPDDDEELKGREAFERIFGALFTAGGEVAKVLPGIEHDVAMKGGLAVVLPVLGFAVGRGLHRAFIGRRKKFAEGYVNAFEGNAEKARAHGEQNRDNENHNDVMYRSFRAMLDAVDPAVVETIGYLAGQYSYAGRKIDGHFRSLGRLLCDLEAGELEDLRALLRGVMSFYPDLDDVGIADLFYDYRPDLTVNVDMGGPKPGTPIGMIPSIARLFLLLKREGFGWSISTSAMPRPKEIAPGDDRMSIPFDAVKELLKTIDPGPVIT